MYEWIDGWMDAFSFLCIYSITYAFVFLLLQEKNM